MNTAWLWISVLLLASSGAGGEFVNLSFEDADRTYMRYPGYWVYPKQLIPGWDVLRGGEASVVWYDGGTFLPGDPTVIDDRGREYPPFAQVPIAGTIAFGIVPQANPHEPGQAGIEQRGLVPEDARSLFFLWKGEDLRVFLDDEQLSFSLWEQRLTDDPYVPLHEYYAADITEFAGAEATLRFEFRSFQPHAFPEDWPERVQALDDISFSSMIIPEPSSVVLLFSGCFALCWLRHRRAGGTRAGADG